MTNDKEGKQPKTAKKAKSKTSSLKYNIIGLALLLAVVSIGYSTTVILMGTDGLVPIVMVVPQSVLAVVILIWKFCK